MHKARRSLVYGQAHGVQVELEEDARDTLAMLDNLRVVRHAVLCCLQWVRTWSNVSCRDHIEVVLI